MTQNPSSGSPAATPLRDDRSDRIPSRELTEEELESIAGGDGAWGDELGRLRGTP